jgi:hypothetical protein
MPKPFGPYYCGVDAPGSSLKNPRHIVVIEKCFIGASRELQYEKIIHACVRELKPKLIGVRLKAGLVGLSKILKTRLLFVIPLRPFASDLTRKL